MPELDFQSAIETNVIKLGTLEMEAVWDQVIVVQDDFQFGTFFGQPEDGVGKTLSADAEKPGRTGDAGFRENARDLLLRPRF